MRRAEIVPAGAGRRLRPAYAEIEHRVTASDEYHPRRTGWRVGGHPAWLHAWADDVAGGVVTNPGVEPGGVPSDTPPRFVGGDLVRGSQPVLDLGVSGSQPSAGAQHDLGTGPARQGDAEEAVEDGGDFAVGQAGVLVEYDDGGLGIRSDLAGGGAAGVAGLERVTTVAGLATVAATATVDVELSDDRPARDIRLILVDDVAFVEAAATTGTAIGQSGFVDFVDLLRGGRQALAVGAVLFAGLAARFPGLCRRRLLRKRSGLALASCDGGFELPAQVVAGLLELGEGAFQLSDAVAQLLILSQEVVVRRRGHPTPRSPATSLTAAVDSGEGKPGWQEGTLNKYEGTSAGVHGDPENVAVHQNTGELLQLSQLLVPLGRHRVV